MTDAPSPDFSISPSVFWHPHRVTSSPSIEHVPFAFWLIPAVKPRALVELGARDGASYCAFCQIIRACGIETKAFAVDTWKGDERDGFYEEHVFEELTKYHDEKYSHFSKLLRSTFDEAAAHFEDESIDLLHINGLHTYKCLTHNFQTWLPKLSSRAVVLSHDNKDGEGSFDMSEAWGELTREYPSFEFHHGNGLSVLGVGKELPESITRLMEAGNDERSAAAIRQAYSTLGQGISAKHSLERKILDCDRLSREVADSNAAMGQLERALESAIEGFSDSIFQGIARLRAWDGSASWRVGGVLSKLSRLGKERTSWVWRPRVLADQIAEMLRHVQEARKLNEMDENTAIRELIRINDSVKEKLHSLERSAPLEILGPLRAAASLRSRLVRPVAGKSHSLRRRGESCDSTLGRSRVESSGPGGDSAKRQGFGAKFAIYYSRSGHYFFREISILLHSGLKGMGFSSELRTESDGRSQRADIHVVVGPHEFFFLDVGASMFDGGQRDNLVMVNTEQPENHWFRLAASTFPRARHIFDPNRAGADFIKKMGFSASHLPPAFLADFSLYNTFGPLPKTQDTESLGDEVCQWLDKDLALSERPIDVSFVGQANRRRSSFFARAAARIERFECHLRLVPQAGPWISDSRDRDSRTRITTGLSRRSKIVLNIHREESPYFEWHRVVNMGLWQRALVISETVNDSQPFVPGVDFVHASLDDIPAAIEYYLRDPVGIAEAENIRNAGFLKLKTQCSLQSLLEGAWRPLIDALSVSGRLQSSL